MDDGCQKSGGLTSGICLQALQREESALRPCKYIIIFHCNSGHSYVSTLNPFGPEVHLDIPPTP